MAISVYKGSELNRLARQFVELKSQELKPINRFASVGDWMLILGDDNPRLKVRYGIYERGTIKLGTKRVKYGVEFGFIAL